MKRVALLLLSVIALSFATAVRAQQADDPACKDHPAITRMPNYWLRSCTHSQFDSHAFPTGPGKTTTVEGELWTFNYYPPTTTGAKPSELQIVRNYENAVKAQGGTVVGTDHGRHTFKLARDGNEIWIDLWAEFTGKYGMTVVQKKAMEQDVTVTAATLATRLKATGHIAVEGIFFDTGKAELKPESQAAIAEIAKLLKADPALKLYVVGHTDNVGLFDANVKLSQARADAVVQSLIGTHGIVAARLRAFGGGPTAPVSTNDTDTGRARNRRVELVKQ